MLEPQSPALFVLLVVIFGALIGATVCARHTAFRVAAACLAFMPAMMFGVLAVTLASGSRSGTLDGSRTHLRLAQQQGYTVRLLVTGPRSRITRVVYVYLPPQYFQPGYQAYRFPVIELIHGQPGQPEDWISVVGGPQDLTYLAEDLPAQIARIVRVRRPGPAWGVAGYSEGGFCAANMALRYPHRYGFAAALSGYFAPYDNQLAGPHRLVSPFGGNHRLREENTPLEEIAKLPAGLAIPRFWLGAGAADRQDVANAEAFWQELRRHQAYVPLTLTAGGRHTMTTWRAQVPSMLTWMTPGLARAAHEQTAAPPRKTVLIAGRDRDLATK